MQVLEGQHHLSRVELGVELSQHASFPDQSEQISSQRERHDEVQVARVDSKILHVYYERMAYGEQESFLVRHVAQMIFPQHFFFFQHLNTVSWCIRDVIGIELVSELPPVSEVFYLGILIAWQVSMGKLPTRLRLCGVVAPEVFPRTNWLGAIRYKA